MMITLSRFWFVKFMLFRYTGIKHDRVWIFLHRNFLYMKVSRNAWYYDKMELAQHVLNFAEPRLISQGQLVSWKVYIKNVYQHLTK